MQRLRSGGGYGALRTSRHHEACSSACAPVFTSHAGAVRIIVRDGDGVWAADKVAETATKCFAWPQKAAIATTLKALEADALHTGVNATLAAMKELAAQPT
ncbi:hypothetical protein TRVL_07465 [Trypanosoma vivax]|nr:hypothetical protein TRVL_07465 [Trypanosoma vivax]